MDVKDKVLACMPHSWERPDRIAEKVAFVFRLEQNSEHILVVLLHLLQLRSEKLVEEQEYGAPQKLHVYRLSPTGKVRWKEILSNNPEVGRACESYLLGGSPI